MPPWLISLLPSIISGVGSLASTASQSATNRRNVAFATLQNKLDWEHQQQINRENQQFQRSAIPTKFGQLTGLGMSPAAALQSVSGVSFSPSSQATIGSAPQEEALDFSGFATVANMMEARRQFNEQMAEQKRKADAEIKEIESRTRLNSLQAFEQEYGISAVQTVDEIMQVPGLTLDDFKDFDALRKKLPENLAKRVNSRTFALLNQMAREKIATDSDQVALRLQLSAERLSKLKETWQKLENQSKTYETLMKKIDAKDYPELSRLRIENMRNANMLQFADYNAKELATMIGYEDLDAKKLENELRRLKTWNERNLRNLAKTHPLADAEVMLIDHLTMLLDILPLRGIFK